MDDSKIHSENIEDAKQQSLGEMTGSAEDEKRLTRSILLKLDTRYDHPVMTVQM